MSEPVEPAPAGIYCLGCRYTLRGLTSRQCPECGRPFDPHKEQTFSRFASRLDELSHAMRNAFPKQQPSDVAIQRLWEQIAHLLNDNMELRATVETITHALIEKGILQEGELGHRLNRQDLFERRGGAMSDQEAIDSLNDEKNSAIA